MLFHCSMYYLSFVPLWVSILFIEAMSLLHGTNNKGTEIVSIAVILIAFVTALNSLLKTLKLRNDETGSTVYQLKKAKEEKLATAELLATFIIPLFAFDFTKWEGMTLFAFFFLVFGYLCVRHNYFCTNIMLDLLNYRVYDCALEDSNGVEIEQKVISLRRLEPQVGIDVFIMGLNNEYSFECFFVEDEE